MGNFHATLPRWPRSPLCNNSYILPLVSLVLWEFGPIYFDHITPIPPATPRSNPSPSFPGKATVKLTDFTIPGQFTEVSSCIPFLPKNFSFLPLVKAPPLGEGGMCPEVEERSHVSAHSRRHSHFPLLFSKTWSAFPPPPLLPPVLLLASIPSCLCQQQFQ